jgi:hypothetical protein
MMFLDDQRKDAGTALLMIDEEIMKNRISSNNQLR